MQKMPSSHRISQQMQGFKDRVHSQLTCNVVDHENEEIVSICVFPGCKNAQRQACHYCGLLHQDHQQHLISIRKVQEMIEKRNITESLAMREFNAFQAQIIQQLKMIKNIINEKESYESNLQTIYRKESLSLQDLSSIGLIHSKEVNNNNQISQFAGSEQKQKINKKYRKIIRQMDDAIQELKSIGLIDQLNINFINNIAQWTPKFSRTLKPSSASLENNDTIIKSIAYQRMLCHGHTLQDGQQNLIPFLFFYQRYKVLYMNKTSEIAIGLYSKSKAEEKMFADYSDKWQGMYVIWSSDSAWQESTYRNTTKTHITFSTNDEIECEFNPQTKIFKVMKPTTGTRYSFNIDKSERDLHPFALIQVKGDTLQLLPSTTAE